MTENNKTVNWCKQTLIELLVMNRTIDRIAKEGKKYLEKSGETSKKGSSGSKSNTKMSGKKKGGSSGADKAKRAAKEFLK